MAERRGAARAPKIKLQLTIDVPSIEKGVDFYGRAFGLEVKTRFGDACVELSGLEAPIYLMLRADGSAASKVADIKRTYVRHWTPVHMDFEVDEIELAVRRAVDAGAHLEGGISQTKFGPMAVLVDPFGNGFCILQFGENRDKAKKK